MEQVPAIIGDVAALALGACVGSFAVTVAYRLPRDISIATPRSFCESCERPVPWWANVPIFAYLATRGRCVMCGAPIRARHLGGELALALAALYLFANFPLGDAVSRFIFITALLISSLVDYDWRRIRNLITFPGVPVGFVLAALFMPEVGWEKLAHRHSRRRRGLVRDRLCLPAGAQTGGRRPGRRILARDGGRVPRDGRACCSRCSLVRSWDRLAGSRSDCSELPRTRPNCRRACVRLSLLRRPQRPAPQVCEPSGSGGITGRRAKRRYQSIRGRPTVRQRKTRSTRCSRPRCRSDPSCRSRPVSTCSFNHSWQAGIYRADGGRYLHHARGRRGLGQDHPGGDSGRRTAPARPARDAHPRTRWHARGRGDPRDLPRSGGLAGRCLRAFAGAGRPRAARA